MTTFLVLLPTVFSEDVTSEASTLERSYVIDTLLHLASFVFLIVMFQWSYSVFELNVTQVSTIAMVILLIIYSVWNTVK